MTLLRDCLGLVILTLAWLVVSLDHCPDGKLPLCPDGSQPQCPGLGGVFAKNTVCPDACDPHSNNCDPWTAPSCIFSDPRVINPRGACACRPGYKATGYANNDVSKQYRLPVEAQDHRVWVAEGVKCDTLCAVPYGLESCREVTLISEECVGGAAVKSPYRSLGALTDDLPLAIDVPQIDFEPLLSSGFTGPAQVLKEYGHNMTIPNATNIHTVDSNRTYFGRRASNVRTLPQSVDWRDRYNIKWLSSIQDQGNCQSCWSFAVVALAETMIRIEHGMWSKRSEADLRDSWGYKCEQSGSMRKAMIWASEGGNGISDPECVPWDETNKPYMPCKDRSGRTVRLPTYEHVGKIGTKDGLASQKKWLDDIGPIVASFEIYQDFKTWNWSSGLPYRRDLTLTINNINGSHAVLIVGYDERKRCWIARNSWGLDHGIDGYFTIEYGEANIDNWAKYGWTNLEPDPWTRRRLHNGNLIITGNGKYHRDFELVFSGQDGISYITRGPGDKGDIPWELQSQIPVSSGFYIIGTNLTAVGQPAMIQTSYKSDYEIVYLTSAQYLRQVSYSQTSKEWTQIDSDDFGDGHVAGYPGFIQNNEGDFSVVVRYDDGSLRYLSRPHARTAATAWLSDNTIATNVLQSGPSLIQTNDIGKGNFLVVAVMNTGQMQLFWRNNDDDSSSSWIAGETFGSGVDSTPPVMIQSSFGTSNELDPGNLELCVAANGQVQHWRRTSGNGHRDAGSGQWHLHRVFGSDIRHVWALVQGYLRRLQVVVEMTDGTMQQWHVEGDQWKFTQVIRW